MWPWRRRGRKEEASVSSAPRKPIATDGVIADVSASHAGSWLTSLFKREPPMEAPPGLFERMVQLAKDLGIDWPGGGGGGVFYDAPKNAAPVWRVHSDFVGCGAIVEVD